MPYSKKSAYKHNRQKPPRRFIKSTFKTVPLSHTEYSGKKFKVKGAKAIVGKLKNKKHNAWKIQSILIPKKK
jgi:hypothetical protein